MINLCIVYCFPFLQICNALLYVQRNFLTVEQGQASRHKYLQRKYTMCYCRICYKVHIRRGPKGFYPPPPTPNPQPPSVTYSIKYKIVHRIKVIVDSQELSRTYCDKIVYLTDKIFFADSYQLVTHFPDFPLWEKRIA